MSDELRYPVGRFGFDPSSAADQRNGWILDIARLPVDLEGALDSLSDEQLDTPYRPEGWTVRQLVHHIADSHLNAYARIRLALTEDAPLIKSYDEKRWAELPDSLSAPVGPSLQMIEGLHSRWATLLRMMEPEDFQRTLVHPESGPGTIEKYTGLYAWHGIHHLAHIRNLKERQGW
ncbi:MAG: putative metal-dependent hydrolase [Bryobacterales bacterium]|nr:putative metal-dependent hydrolase [Bryobacterales bacterium]